MRALARSLFTITTAATLAVAGLTATNDNVTIPMAAMVVTAVIVHRHRANLRRLWAGTERRVGQRLTDMTQVPELPR